MKVKMIAAAVAGFALMSGAAFADDAGHGKIEFHGSIINAPCSIDNDSSDQHIGLGEIANKALDNGGKSTPQPFYITLTDCTVTTAQQVQVTFTGPTDANNEDLLGITGSASGAGIAMTDGSGTLIKLGTASAAQTIQDGTNTLSFSAYLQGDTTSGTVTPGEFSTVTNFTLAYP